MLNTEMSTTFNTIEAFYILMLFLFGACFGSFANAIIYRLPLEISILGRSQCTKCKNQISAWHNIPIFSYFILKGKCEKCSAPFSIRYPTVEFITGILFSAVYFYYGQAWITLEYLILVWGLVVCSFIDLDHMILPDEFTLGGIVIGFIGAFLNPERTVLDAFWGFLFGGGILWSVAYIYYLFTGREGLGGGDIKLLAWLGTILGWKASLIGHLHCRE